MDDMPIVATSCRICGNAEGNRGFEVREMMFGTRERFGYTACGSCGCLQINEVPSDLARYYAGYYSLTPTKLSVPTRLIKDAAGRHVAGEVSRVGAAVVRLVGPPRFAEWVRTAGVDRDARILDVGAGGGDRVRNLAAAGYRCIVGIEPFLDADLDVGFGATVQRRRLEECDGGWDLVMFHHSFEHVPDPHGTLGQAAHLLAPGGTILIRVPVADSEAWEVYGSDWVQLDAPRHLHLLTRVGMEVLADAAGLTVVRVVHDSGPFQFWGSEQYRAGVPLNLAAQPPLSRLRALRQRRSRRLKKRAVELNARGRGDQAAFYLRRLAHV